MSVPVIGISSCLLGNRVRYDGGHTLDLCITETLGPYVRWLPVCPEVQCGLPVPREAMLLRGTPESPRLITIRSGEDLTAMMNGWVRGRLSELRSEGLAGFIFKSKSPSCGIRDVKIYPAKGRTYRRGAGLFGEAFLKEFPLIPAEDEVRLQSPQLRENFLHRAMVLHQWSEYVRQGISVSGLMAFHSGMKYLVMAHSPKHYKALGPLVAHCTEETADDVHARYAAALMEGLALLTTVRKHTNVLQHMAGYFKKHLTGAERAGLLQAIESTHRGLVPLSVPLALLNHYVDKYDEAYLRKQVYLTLPLLPSS